MGKISAEGVKRYCKSLFLACAVYLWGANAEVITKSLFESLKKTFGAKKYEKIRFEDVEGKIGADCSGFLKPLSGKDDTASGYYSSCPDRGKISRMPMNRMCLIFRKQNLKIVHVAIYTGDGMLYEMYNGCEYREFKESEWDCYGVPDWIEQSAELAVGDMVSVVAPLQRYNTAMDAKNGMRALKKAYEPGVYFVYKIDAATGSVNITKNKGSAGSWVVL
ncbi:MAG: hypothetical protein IKB07_08125 [Lachnospiraceae bacterium]|nr:hypothetical protein [Lachnospiraceae bacterium]